MTPPPLPPLLPASVGISNAPAGTPGPTSLGAVILAIGSLEVTALLRPGAWLKFGLFALGLIVVTKLSVPHGNEKMFSQWMVDVVALKIVPLLCLVVGGGVLRNQIRSFTIEYLWTRPARKAHLAIAAWCSTVSIVFAQAIVGTVVVHATGSFLGVENIWDGLPMLLITEFVVILAFSALSLALGVYSGKYMVFGLLYGLIVESGVSRIPTNLNLLSVTHHAEVLLSYRTEDIGTLGLMPLVQSLVGTVGIAAVGLAVAAALFSFKQYSVGTEKES